jgi:hypothetical protein
MMASSGPDCIARGTGYLENGAAVTTGAAGSFDDCARAVAGCVWKEIMPTRAVSLAALLAAAHDSP